MQKNIRNALLMDGGYRSFTGNSPYNQDTQTQYYANPTKGFYQKNVQYGSNVVTAQVQGTDYNDFYTYKELRIRVSNLIDPTTGQNLGSDWQRMIVEDANIDFLPRGAKVVFNGNVWLVVNPQNVQSVLGTSIIRRCNATWNHLDAYGNVLSEPFVYGHGGNDLATGNRVTEYMILMNMYQHSLMQLNAETAVMHHNMRMILGNQCYAVRGLQNFVQEFSQDQNSTHIQYFDLEAAEPLEMDDVENRVAGGKAFSWVINIEGADKMQVDGTQTFTATSFKDGQPVDRALSTTYSWESSDETVLVINNDGEATAKKAGAVTVTCTLNENPNITADMTLTVEEPVMENYIGWRSEPPKTIEQYNSATLSAVVFEYGAATKEPVTFSFTGAQPESYSATVSANNVTIQCWLEDKEPLVVTATSGDLQATATIQLRGW